MCEVKQGLQRLRLACRLGVAARDLASETVEVPKEGIGRVRVKSPFNGSFSIVVMAKTETRVTEKQVVALARYHRFSCSFGSKCSDWSRFRTALHLSLTMKKASRFGR